jgi:hypothetical protein
MTTSMMTDGKDNLTDKQGRQAKNVSYISMDPTPAI